MCYVQGTTSLKFISHNDTFLQQVTEIVEKLFADIVINLDSNMTPQNIKSYAARSGHDEVTATGIQDTNTMKPIHMAGFKKALLQILEETMNKNIKVQINQAIQAMKEALQ